LNHSSAILCLVQLLSDTLHVEPSVLSRSNRPNGSPIPIVEQAKFLGLIFDQKLTFVPHLKYLRQKCMKALNLIRVTSNPKWGSDEKTLHLYRSLIRSKLDYGCVVYGSARKSYLQMLDPIQNQALHLCLGAFRTSPASSLLVEANEMPLDIRRRRLSAQYLLPEFTSNTTIPARSCILNNRFAKLFDKQPNQTRPLGYRVRDDLRDIGFVPKDVLLTSVIPTPPWLLSRPTVDLSLTELVKSETNPDIFKTRYLQLCDELSDFHCIYTDGSKMSNGAATSDSIIYYSTYLLTMSLAYTYGLSERRSTPRIYRYNTCSETKSQKQFENLSKMELHVRNSYEQTENCN